MMNLSLTEIFTKPMIDMSVLDEFIMLAIIIAVSLVIAVIGEIVYQIEKRKGKKNNKNAE